MNVLNVTDVERELERIAACALHAAARDWIAHCARNAIINKKMTAKDFMQNFVLYDPRAKILDAPSYDELEDWAKTALLRNEKIYWFDPIQPQRRPFWKMLEAIVHWFNSWPKDDRRLNRLTRISFTTAINAAAMWNKDINENLWNYVQDRPPVILRFKDGYHWVRLITELHFEREEQLMNHCIYRANYFRNHAKGSAAYVSLRDEDNKPHVTMEINLDEGTHPLAGSVMQCKGNSNQKPAKPYQPYIVAALRQMHWAVRGDEEHIDTGLTPVPVVGHIKGKLGRPQSVD